MAPNPLDEGRLEENLSLLEVVLFENLIEGNADFVIVCVEFMLECLCLLREEQKHHCDDVFLGQKVFRNAKAGK